MSNELLKKVKVDVEQKKITKSEGFRKLYEDGMSVGEIAKATDSHYSFVYGVIAGSFENVRKNKGPSKSDEIRKLADTGLTPGQIAKELNSNYSFVHSVVKKHKQTQKPEKAQEQQNDS